MHNYITVNLSLLCMEGCIHILGFLSMDRWTKSQSGFEISCRDFGRFWLPEGTRSGRGEALVGYCFKKKDLEKKQESLGKHSHFVKLQIQTQANVAEILRDRLT